MKETFIKIGNQIKDFWKSRSSKQKTLYISMMAAVILIAAAVVFLTSRTTLVPLYSDLSPTETGSIKENLDGRGITSEIADNGSTILVPSEMADTLLVELAAEGIPKSGSIDYSYFSENASFGMTDNEFNVIKQDAMQNEIAGLIKGIEGVQGAEVILTLPDKGVFVSDTKEEASASIVLNTKPGQEFEEKQIQALYHLVSKSVPNLPTDNIVIMNQYFEYFDLNNSGSNSTDSFASQNEIKKEIEKDIQRRVQSMLGTIMGNDKVVVSVTADVDFTQENREENLVEPVDEENMEGLTISAQKLSETYTGETGAEGGTPVTEDPSDSLGSQYLEGSNGNGDYEKTEETVNTEVNRIRKEISESPYKVRDLGIQVMVEPPDANDTNSLPEERITDIRDILGTIVRTSIDKSENENPLTDDQLEEKIAISIQPFNGKVTFDEQQENSTPWWIYVIGGVLCLAIILLLIFIIKSRKNKEIEIEQYEEPIPPVLVADIVDEAESEATVKRKQLEKLAKEKPDEFAKLLRSWITED
ncbi:flagellar basal-body MS-ring/collar protein FliF [Bacillus sp. D386]|uniref:flagellar basal-body MS-ring/collar protein FliF n=1 Tax=Bacillus sp. D386 TaxID=2587155 RepID=UPI001122B404|nr:flagellar basal-body MS-ring/collar protein FliF [Bacillus sp. D386]